jgi:hypothetical protein
VVGGEFDAWAASCEKIAQFPVINDIDGPVVFGDPFDEMCAVVTVKYWYMNIKQKQLTVLQGLNGHGANTLPAVCHCEQKAQRLCH